MKKTIIFIITLFFFFALTLVYGQDGFRDIPFGASWDEVSKKAGPLWGKGEAKDIFGQKSENTYQLHKFKLGKQEVEVVFIFNHTGHFIRFLFETRRLGADHFKLVCSDGQYLTSVFTSKYGPPSKSFGIPSSILEVRHEQLRPLAVWDHPTMMILTGLRTYDVRYYAVGDVGSIDLMTKENKYQEELKSKSVGEAASKF